MPLLVAALLDLQLSESYIGLVVVVVFWGGTISINLWEIVQNHTINITSFVRISVATSIIVLPEWPFAQSSFIMIALFMHSTLSIHLRKKLSYPFVACTLLTPIHFFALLNEPSGYLSIFLLSLMITIHSIYLIKEAFSYKRVRKS